MQIAETKQTTNAVSKNETAKQSFFFQPKLSINQPNDIYEQEADAMADKVMRMPASNEKNNFFFKPANSIQLKCAHCEEEELQKKVQRKNINGADRIIQRQDKDEEPRQTTDQNNSFHLRLPPLTQPPYLRPPLDSIDYLGLKETFFNRGVLFPGSYMDGAQQEWARQYLFYKQLGLGNAVGNSFIGNSLRFFGVKPPGGDWNAWLSNTTTPLAVDSALSRNFPNFNELEEQRGGLPAPTIIHLPEVHFKKANNDGPVDVTETTENYLNNLSGGEPLSKQEKNFFESGVGSDFSEVRIHNDSAANESAKNLNALAYTHRNNIVFGTNQYQSNTENGKRLLAHELTHVVQQTSGKEKNIQRDKDKQTGNPAPPVPGKDDNNQPVFRIELPEPLILKVNGIGVSYPLAIKGSNGNIIDIGPYTGKKWIDFPLAALEALGIPILSYMAFHGGALTQYRGLKFSRAQGLSGGTSFIRNALHYGYIQADETYLYGAPGSYMPEEYAGIPNLHIKANPMDIGTMIDVRYFNDPLEGHPNNPAIMFSLTSSFESNPLDALVNIGGAFGHMIKGDLYSLPGVTHNYPDFDK